MNGLIPVGEQTMIKKCAISPRSVEGSDFAQPQKKYGRTRDVESVFSIRRGSLYNAERLGFVRGVSLQLRGRKGCLKLWDMESIEAWICSQMEAAKHGEGK